MNLIVKGKMYKTIFGYNDFEITKTGIIRHKDTKIEPHVSPSGTVYLPILNGKLFRIAVSRLIALAYSERTENDISKLFVYYKDGNRKNIHADNLALYTRDVFERIKWEDYRKNTNERFPMPINLGDGLYPNPWQIKEYPGYYRIPFAENALAINKEGEIINLANGTKKKIWVDGAGYKTFSIRINNKNTPYNLHRILALLFLPIPIHLAYMDYSELQVNHINAIKIDNGLSNLEWCTPAENMEHMYSLNLSTTVKRPVLRKNILTNEITYFDCIKKCANYLLISHVSLRTHLLSNAAGKICIDNCIYKFDDGTKWPNEFRDIGSNYNKLNNVTTVGKNVETGKIYLFFNLKEAADKLNIRFYKLMNSRFRKGFDYPCEGWIFYPLTDACFKSK